VNVNIPPIESFGISDIGTSRTNNEDVFAELSEEHFYILADGMGGHLAGEVAAKEAVLHMCDSVEKFLRAHPFPSLAAAQNHLYKSFAEANTWIRSLSQRHTDFNGMGTTLCCAWIIGQELLYGHVGDSRIYRYRHQKIEALTEDHTTRQHSTQKQVLTKALGISLILEPEIDHIHLAPGDLYLLSSDGLHGALSDRQIEAILRYEPNIKEASIQLIEAAKKAGGTDNITLLILKYEKNLPR
jgi:protein phosphatase